jgi:ssRNA-specific RNase YbeY (16S rRNA maturation enzyme)
MAFLGLLAVHVAEAFGFAKGLAAESGGSVGSHAWRLLIFGYLHVMGVRYDS